MICPYCSTGIHFGPKPAQIGRWGMTVISALGQTCPECHKIIIVLEVNKFTICDPISEEEFLTSSDEILVYPASRHKTLPREVPESINQEFQEAVGVLTISPKASAALSRRILQILLRDYAGAKSDNLSKAIDEAQTNPKMSGDLSRMLDYIREVGNFAAHPRKSTNTGEILDVEPEEANINLEVLEALFDFYIVQPEKNKKRFDALNKKLNETGHNPI